MKQCIILYAMIRYRYRRIVLFFARLIASFFFWDIALPRLGGRSWSQRTRSGRLQRSAQNFRALAIDMGGVMIKVGQFLSSRVDVLPQEITQELSGLQDEVPAESFADIRKVVEDEFGIPIERKFSWFDELPLAAASLGQVHRARIQLNTSPVSTAEGDFVPEPVHFLDKDGSFDVVVKIQRPNIESLIATDLAALKTVGNWLQHYGPIRRRADLPALLAEFTRILYEEIDYLAEARNAGIFAENFKDDSGVRVPAVVQTHTAKRVLTLQNVLAIKITDYEAITAAGIDRSAVASRLLDTYLKQIFEDGFFHADPHPGNLFVFPCLGSDRDGDLNWQLTFVDFGMVGRISPELRQGLREMVIAVGTRDTARLVRSYQMVGVLLPSADLDLLERAEAKAFERFWGKNMSELQKISPQEVREFAGEFRELLYSMPFQIPHNIIFLGRAVGILSGMCTGLDPQFNVWDHLAPYAQKLIADETKNYGEFWMDELKILARSFLSVPVKMDSILAKMERGEISVRSPEILHQVNRLEGAIRQVAGAIVFAALLLGGIELSVVGRELPGNILFAGAALSLLWTIFAGRQKG